jgi:hypothetical protein
LMKELRGCEQGKISSRAGRVEGNKKSRRGGMLDQLI